MKKCIIIGAGILGASTAYQLAKRGADVRIIDRHDQGQATEAAAGIICPWISQRRNQVWYRLATAGARFYPQLIAELEAMGETCTGYARVGALSIHKEKSKLDTLEERARTRQVDAPELGTIKRLDHLAARERFPLLDEGYEAVEISGAARVDGRELRDALLRSATRHGAKQLSGDAILIEMEGRVTGVRVGHDTYESDEVIICAGAWAASLFEPLGIDFKVHYQKAQIVHLQMPKATDTRHWPVIMPPTTQYVLAFEHGRIVIGATHENDPDGYDIRVTAGGLQEVLSKGLEVAPALYAGELLEVRVGFRPFTPNFLPVCGRVPGWEGLLSANGLGASGLTVGPWIGAQLAKLALDLEPDMPLDDYALEQVMKPLEA